MRSQVFYRAAQGSSSVLFFFLLLVLLLSAEYMSGPRASRKSANDSRTGSCTRSFPDHRRLHSSRCMQSTSTACRRQAGLKDAYIFFTASYLISLLLDQCFTALWVHPFMTAQCPQSLHAGGQEAVSNLSQPQVSWPHICRTSMSGLPSKECQQWLLGVHTCLLCNLLMLQCMFCCFWHNCQ